VSATHLGKLSYDAAIRALDVQERGVEQLRARTGTLLAASSLTASFLGAQAIQRSRGSLGTLDAFALVSLAASMLLCINVLLPKTGLVFSLSAPRMYESLFEVADDDRELYRRLIYWLEDYWQSNQARVQRLGRYYSGAAFALLLQLMFWAWALMSTIV
jgi:hypothetical protein